MRLFLVLVLALAGLAAAVPHDGHRGDVGPSHSRPRRFLLGWGVADDFFHNVAAQIRHAWAESAAWAKHVFSWARRHPEHSTVYRVLVPHGTGVVAIIESGGHRHGLRHHNHDHHRALLWDGKRLTEQQQQGHGGVANNATTAGLDGSISVFHAGANHTVPLSAFAKYLSHVAAGSKVHVDVRGSSWSNLRVVLRVVGARGEDQQKSVSVLLSTVLKEAEQAAAASEKSSSRKESSEESSSEKKSHKKKSKESEKKSHKKKSKESEKESHKKKSKESEKESHKKKSKESEKKSKKSSKTSSSSASSLRWDGRDLVWADVGSGKHVRRRLRVTQNGVSQVIPFAVLATHLKAVPAGSDISFEVTGHSLKDLRVLLHVHGAHKQTVSLLVSKLVAETEASKHSGSARARIEGKDGAKKVHVAVPVVAAQQV